MTSPAVEIARMFFGTIAGLGVLGLDLWFYKICLRDDDGDIDFVPMLIMLAALPAGLGIIAYSIGGPTLLQVILNQVS